MQKIKIEGLKIEIESASSFLQTKESQVSELENKGKNISDDSKKYQMQLNNLSAKYDNIRESIKELNKFSKESEKELAISKNVKIHYLFFYKKIKFPLFRHLKMF